MKTRLNKRYEVNETTRDSKKTYVLFDLEGEQGIYVTTDLIDLAKKYMALRVDEKKPATPKASLSFQRKVFEVMSCATLFYGLKESDVIDPELIAAAKDELKEYKTVKTDGIGIAGEMKIIGDCTSVDPLYNIATVVPCVLPQSYIDKNKIKSEDGKEVFGWMACYVHPDVKERNNPARGSYKGVLYFQDLNKALRVVGGVNKTRMIRFQEERELYLEKQAKAGSCESCKI